MAKIRISLVLQIVSRIVFKFFVKKSVQMLLMHFIFESLITSFEWPHNTLGIKKKESTFSKIYFFP